MLSRIRTLVLIVALLALSGGWAGGTAVAQEGQNVAVNISGAKGGAVPVSVLGVDSEGTSELGSARPGGSVDVDMDLVNFTKGSRIEAWSAGDRVVLAPAGEGEEACEEVRRRADEEEDCERLGAFVWLAGTQVTVDLGDGTFTSERPEPTGGGGESGTMGTPAGIGGWTFDGRLGVALPFGNLADITKLGLSVGVGLGYQLDPRWQLRFDADGNFLGGEEVEFAPGETVELPGLDLFGFQGGVQVDLTEAGPATGGLFVRPYLGGGMTVIDGEGDSETKVTASGALKVGVHVNETTEVAARAKLHRIFLDEDDFNVGQLQLVLGFSF